MTIFSAALAALKFGIKPIKYFIDNTFRSKVRPVPGSVLYCDLWVAAEHSGIYVGRRQISNIVVDGIAESEVQLSSPDSFTSKSLLGSKIYVSCDRHGAVGHDAVAERSLFDVGERSFYGLVIKNCHQFSSKCVKTLESGAPSLWDQLNPLNWIDSTWEPTIRELKRTAESRLGATKWRLWDWENDFGDDEDDDSGEHNTPRRPPSPASQPTELDWQAHHEFFKNLPLSASNIARIRDELGTLQDYQREIADENLPADVLKKLDGFGQWLQEISTAYDHAEGFLRATGADLSYGELKACQEDFQALAKQLQENAQIRDLVRKMGRHYLSEEHRKRSRIPEASKSEVHGVHRSDDVMRMLPSELSNLEDDTLETLFFARLLEKNLLTYELSGITLGVGETTETRKKRTGPIVACLDTSGSMAGLPLLRAKALLLAISLILKREDRALHVLLFGSSGEIREFAMDGKADLAGLLQFLGTGFGGGTDFETPLQRAFELIKRHENFKKADVLMISDGDCAVSTAFLRTIETQKNTLNCMVYSVLCAGSRVDDPFSDEVVVL